MRPGALWEKVVCEYIRDRGFPNARRRFAQGANDKGDLEGVPMTIQIKNTGIMSMGTAMMAARKQALADGKNDRYCVIHKRRNHGVEDAYMTVPLWLGVQMMEAIWGQPVE